MPDISDIYKKPERTEDAPPASMPPSDIPPPHRRAIVALVLMMLLLAAVTIFFSLQEEDEMGEFDYLLGGVSRATNSLETAAAADGRPMAIEALLADFESPGQAPPPDLSPQRMAEAMTHLRSAQQYLGVRDLEAAEQEINEALKVWPGMRMAVQLLGSLYTQRGQFEQAIVLLERLLAEEPFSADILNNLAINYMHKGMMGKAEELLITSLQVRPDFGIAYLNLGFVYLRMNRYDLAAENFELGLKEMPENPGVINNLAVCLVRLGDVEQARTLLVGLTEQYPAQPTAYFNLAITHVLERNDAAALEFIRRGAEQCTPSQLQLYLSDPDFDPLRSLPAFQRLVSERFPDIPSRSPNP